MSKHIVTGISCMAMASEEVAPGTPVEDIHGEHSAVWFFEIMTGCIGPDDLGVHNQTHVDVSGTRLIVVAHWLDGFLRPGSPGSVRFYFDSQRTNHEQRIALNRAFLGETGGPL